MKCWRHIRTFPLLVLLYLSPPSLTPLNVVVIELQDIPALAAAMSARESASSNATLPHSPSRGKIRPGKELIVLTDDNAPEQEASPQSEASAEAAESATLSLTINATTKKLSQMSMMERQAEWLRKKQEKVDAERQRIEEEKEKELTFQPKLIRRNTFGDRPKADTSTTAPAAATATMNKATTGSLTTRAESAGISKRSEKTIENLSATAPPAQKLPSKPTQQQQQQQSQQFLLQQTAAAGSSRLATMAKKGK